MATYVPLEMYVEHLAMEVRPNSTPTSHKREFRQELVLQRKEPVKKFYIKQKPTSKLLNETRSRRR
jgi:hypothetical protein